MLRVAITSFGFACDSKIFVSKHRLFFAAFFHDIGKFKLDQKLLNARRKLTAEEMEYVKTHAVEGSKLLKHFKNISKIVKYHHENYDGSGYYGLKSNLIPLESQIIRIVDVYDSLTHKRPYKDSLKAALAIKIMVDESKNFNPMLLELFINHITKSRKYKSVR